MSAHGERCRGRPLAVPASAVVDEVRRMIAAHAGAPCPTLGHMAAALGVHPRVVERMVVVMREAGELQVRRPSTAQNCPKRRMRVRIGDAWTQWTGWTVREAYVIARQDHCQAVMAAGGFQ